MTSLFRKVIQTTANASSVGTDLGHSNLTLHSETRVQKELISSQSFPADRMMRWSSQQYLETPM